MYRRTWWLIVSIQPEDLKYFLDPANRYADVYKVGSRSIDSLMEQSRILMYNLHCATPIQPVKFWFYNGIVTKTLDNVGMRIKGGISRSWVKKGWKLSFNTFESGTHTFLHMNECASHESVNL